MTKHLENLVSQALELFNKIRIGIKDIINFNIYL